MDENKESCLTVANINNIGRMEFVEKLKVSAEENSDIQKVLACNVSLCEYKIDSIDRKASVSGKLFYNILYKDAEGMIICLKNCVPFVQNYENDQISATGKIFLRDICIDSTCEFSGHDFEINANCSMQIFNYDKANHCVITALGSNMAVKRDSMSVMHMQGLIEGSFMTECEMDIKDNIVRLICVETSFAATDFVPLDKCIGINGTLSANVIYETDVDGEIRIMSKTDTCAVKGEIESAEMDIECLLDLQACVNNAKTQTTLSAQSGRTVANIEACIECRGIAFKMIKQDMIVDTYCCDCDITETKESKMMFEMFTLACSQEDLTGEVEITEFMPDEILALVNNSVCVTKSQQLGGKWLIEGVTSGTLICHDDAHMLAEKSFEIPFQLERDDDIPSNTKFIICNAKVISGRAKIKRADMIVVEMQLMIKGVGYTTEFREFLVDVKPGSTFDFGDIAYQIFVAQPNEDLWCLCKRLKTNEAKLLEMNKDLQMPLRGGERIYIQR